MSINIDAYCLNPIQYQKTLLKSEIEYYDKICALRKQISDKDQKIIDIINLPVVMIQSMLSPEGLKMMGLFMGIDLVSKSAYKSLLNFLSKGLSQELIDEIAVRAGSEAGSLVSSAIITSVVADSVVEASAASIAISVMSMAAEVIDVAAFLQIILMMIGMIIDTWDPCGFGQELDADSLDKLSDGVNTQFMIKFLEAVSVSTDSVGNTIQLNNWPLEYYADSLSDFQNFNSTQNQVNYWNYSIDYLKSLSVNSNGEKIVWPNVNAIDNTEFKKIIKTVSISLANNNTYVTNFIDKWWVILLGIIIIIILFIFLIR